jgi:hypothetical protein
MQKAEMQELFGLQKEGMRMGFAKVCYNCTERHYLCQATCERYKLAKEKHDAEQAVIKAERAKQNSIDNFVIEAKIKAKKRRGDR